MNNKSKLSLASLIFLAACTDHAVEDTNVSRVGSSLQAASVASHDAADDLCLSTCETDFECCPDYQAWYEESMTLSSSSPGCELSCCVPLHVEEELVCRDESLTSK